MAELNFSAFNSIESRIESVINLDDSLKILECFLASRELSLFPKHSVSLIS